MKRSPVIYVFILSLILIIIFLPSCSENEPLKPQTERIDNPKVKESFENFVIPIIESLEVEKLKEFGFGPPLEEMKMISNLMTSINGLSVSLDPHTLQTKPERERGYMTGDLSFLGSGDYGVLYILELSFVKLSENERWKLITFYGYIEDYSKDFPEYFSEFPEFFYKDYPEHFSKDSSKDSSKNLFDSEYVGTSILPKKVHTYFKSKFETIDSEIWEISKPRSETSQ